MSELLSQQAPAVSIVIPAKNEADNIRPLIAEIQAAMDDRYSYELIYIDDGSTDTTWDELQALRASAHLLEQKVAFLELVVSQRLQLHARDSGADLDRELEETHGLERGADGTYKHLLSMPMSSMTRDRKTSLEAELAAARASTEELERTEAALLWRRDLDALEAVLKGWDAAKAARRDKKGGEEEEEEA